MQFMQKVAQTLLKNIGLYFALFVAVWLLGWTANALYKTAFDLGRLEELGKFILGKYVTDSGLNTQFGLKEGKQNVEQK
jgi:hypothetical protein